jgi:inosine-uridine nucleoside N-ribohydrolase
MRTCTPSPIGLLVFLAAVLFPPLLEASDPAPPPRIPILLDTDIGGDIDDAFALALALTSPELDLQGITTVGTAAEDRAWIVCRLLTAAGRRDIPVAWGRHPPATVPQQDGNPADAIKLQIQYRRHPAVIFNRTSKPSKDSAVEFLYSRLKAQPGKLTIVAIGPLTNIARLLTDHPDCKPWIRRIVLMGGAVRAGYEGKPRPEPEWNIRCDIPAARTVFTSGVPLVVAPLDATATVQLHAPLRQKLFAACTPLTFQIQSLYELWNQPTPILFDPVAVALAFTERFCTMEDLTLRIDDKGMTREARTPAGGKPNARVATAIRAEEFLKWYVDRVGAGPAVLPKAPANRSSLIPRGGMPNRVHCFEDFETDIEQSWWMSGKLELARVPPGSRRACRSVLTQDFDDRMGDTKTMYSAVIFNPVPGPPMGRNTRLSFRYRLQGTDTLRIQIYSLTNGYHRYLSLTGLPQGRWESGTVDMTAVRRPDGSGGPLSENERIDDIQFYVDPRAEVLIDDIVLYDAAVEGERRPFPKRILFTAWFDTGKQGGEWPGTFDIVDKAGNFWKAARSVDNAGLGHPWIRLHLRGLRPLGEVTHLSFRYRLTGAGTMRVVLVNRTSKDTHVVEVKDLAMDRWAETTVDFTTDSRRGSGRPGKPMAGEQVDEVHFLLPRGATLLLDDVLLFEPGAKEP